MSPSTPRQPLVLRATGIGCLLFLLLVVQFAVLYLQMSLHQRVTFGGLPGFVPLLPLGGFTVLLLLLAATAVRRERPAGLLIGAGLFLLALAPFLARVGGCEVAGDMASLTPLLRIIRRGVFVGWTTANGACHVYLNGVLLAVGQLCLGAGLWSATMTDRSICWLRQTVGNY